MKKTLPAADNPYLWQVLRGCHPRGRPAPWLELTRRPCRPKLTWKVGSMADALRVRPRAFDFVHLSNILDWLDPDEARGTLDLAWRALRPGGLVLIRQLNSGLDIPRLGERFECMAEWARSLLRTDRSFFYRSLHVGRKP